MNQLKIGIRDDRSAFSPGEELTGAVGWNLPKPPSAIEVRLIWFTRGKGTEDVCLAETVRFDHPQAAEARPFKIQLPLAPYSFSGKLISLLWAVEVVALPSKESARVEFSLAPGGIEVRLPDIPQPAAKNLKRFFSRQPA